MSIQTCSYCHQPVRPGAKFCKKCGRPIVVNPKGFQNPSGSDRVRCTNCGTLNRAGAKFCAKCRSDLPIGARAPIVNSPRGAENERTRMPKWAWLGAGAAIVVLCFIVSIAAWVGTNGGKKIASASVTPAVTPPITALAQTPSPMVTPANDPDYQVLTDKQFGYEITVPKTWSIAILKGQRDGIPGSPSWSALIANVEIHSLQSFQPGTAFVFEISQEPMNSEDELLTRIVDTVETQPGEILRREQGKTIEYYTTKLLPDEYGRRVAGRWFWDGKQLLAATVFLLDPTTTETDRIDQALDSMHLLTR